MIHERIDEALLADTFLAASKEHTYTGLAACRRYDVLLLRHDLGKEIERRDALSVDIDRCRRRHADFAEDLDHRQEVSLKCREITDRCGFRKLSAQCIQDFVVDHVEVSLTDLREVVLGLHAHRRDLHDLSVGPHAAVGRDLTEALQHRCIHKIRMGIRAGIHIEDIHSLDIVHQLDSGILGQCVDDTRVKATADDGRQFLLAELLVVGIFCIDIAVGRTFRHIKGRIDIVRPHLEAKIHYLQIQRGRRKVDDQIRMIDLGHKKCLLHIADIRKCSNDLLLVGTVFLLIFIALGLRAPAETHFAKVYRILGQHRNNGAR